MCPKKSRQPYSGPDYSASPAGAAGGSPRAPTGDLREEISLLREIIHEVGDLVSGDGAELTERPLKDWLHVLTGLGYACDRLAHLLKTQRELDGDQDAVELIQQALSTAVVKLQTDAAAPNTIGEAGEHG